MNKDYWSFTTMEYVEQLVKANGALAVRKKGDRGYFHLSGLDYIEGNYVAVSQGGQYFTFNELVSEFVFPDGKPVGKEIPCD